MAQRYLLITADDFGIGPATSQGILELAAKRLVTGTVLLVNSPYAEQAAALWRRNGAGLEVGWHPCLTLDRPILPAHNVSSLVGPDGCFHPLGRFLKRLWLGRIRPREIQSELTAQYRRFQDLLGHSPTLVNAHHHIHVFPPVGWILLDLMKEQKILPFVRNVQEPWHILAGVPGARAKRTFLALFGKRCAQRFRQAGFLGNDWLAGVTNPECVSDPLYLTRWLSRLPGNVVELTCHPGYWDTTLIGRDCSETDGQLRRRVRELHLLRDPSFRDVCRRAGFMLVSASELRRGVQSYAA